MRPKRSPSRSKRRRCGRSSRSSSSRWTTTGSGAACARTRRSCTCPARSRTRSGSATASSRRQPGSARCEAEEAEGETRLVRRYSRRVRARRAVPTSRPSPGLAVATIAPALEALEPELERLTDERGRELYDLRGAPRPPADTPAPLRLLGEWDNVLLAHADRTRMFDDETRRRVIRKNGDVQPTILLDGFVAGTWWWRRQEGRRDAGGDAVREADEGREGRPGAGGGARARASSSRLRPASRSNTRADRPRASDLAQNGGDDVVREHEEQPHARGKHVAAGRSATR